MKRILHVSYGGLKNSGVGTVIFSIVEPLYEKFNFECVVFKKEHERENDFLKYGKLHRVGCYSGTIFEKIFRNFIMYRAIYKICKENKFDVIHVHNQSDAGIVLKAATKAGVKKRISHIHVTKTTEKQNLLKRLRNKRNKKLIDKYSTVKLGCSKQACEDFYKTKEYKVIYNSIDLVKFNFKNKIKHDGIRFIHVGKFSSSKNQCFVLNVFSEIKKTIKNATLQLIGFGEDEERLKLKIKNLGLEDSVQVNYGNNDFVAKCLKVSDFMIFPSKFEGFGIVLIEAQASGCFCFVSDAIQDEADCGFLEKISLDKSAQVWADIIIEKINKKDTVNFDEVAHRLKAYDKGVIAEEYAKLYEE